MRAYKTIIELAQDIEASDPIDWNKLSIDRDLVYDMLVSQVVERLEQSRAEDGYELLMVATIVHLTVQNFALELELGNIKGKGD